MCTTQPLTYSAQNVRLEIGCGLILELVEEKLGEVFASLVDQTRLELHRLALQADSWRYGEIAGPGTLRCEQCGEEVRRAATHEIPRCPSCGGERFRRAAG